ncbi:MAG: GNAT family acetyltransferase [Planctomycetota bacterium]
MGPGEALSGAPTIARFDTVMHQDGVVALLAAVFPNPAPHNEPGFVIAQKLPQKDDLFWMACNPDGRVIGTVLAAYDGNRGWLYCLAVAPESRREGVGSALVRHAKQALSELGYQKLNLQVVQSKDDAVRFYERLGFGAEARVSMGKRLDS